MDCASTKGQTSCDIVSAMLESDFYKAMTDTQKTEAVKLAYTCAGHVAAEVVTGGSCDKILHIFVMHRSHGTTAMEL